MAQSSDRRPWRAVLASVAAVVCFVALHGVFYLPGELRRLSELKALHISCHLPGEGQLPAVSTCRRAPQNLSDHPFHLAIHDPAGQPATRLLWPDLSPVSLARGTAANQFLLGNEDGGVYLLDLLSPAQPPRFIGRPSGCIVDHMAITGDGRWILCESVWRLYAWNVTAGAVRWQQDDITCFLLDSKSPTVWCGTGRVGVLELDLETGRRLCSWGQSLGHIRALAVSPCGERLAVVHGANGLLVLNRRTGASLWSVPSELTNDPGAPLAVCSPCGRVLVSIAQGNDRQLAFWDAHSGRRLGTLSGHSKRPIGAAFTADGKLHSWGGDDVRIWDVQSG